MKGITKNAKNKNKLIKNSISIISVFILLVLSYMFFGKIYFQSKLATYDVTTKSMGDGTKLFTDDTWKDHVLSYASRLGRKLKDGTEEQKWLFSDTKNEYKNLYCVQSGKSHAESYDAYDVYNLTENQIKTYFYGEALYNHFLWVIENMYLLDMDDSEINEQFFNKLETIDPDVRSTFDNMENELNTLFDNAGLKRQDDTSNYIFNLYKRGKLTNETATIDSRENLIKTIQNYVLLQYVVQKSGQPGESILDRDGNLNTKLRTYSNNASQKKDEFNDSNSKYSTKFVKDLANYLINGYNKENYNSNKYRNFNSSNYDGKVNIDKSEAKYNVSEYKVGPFKITNKYGFSVNVKDVKIANAQSYKIVDENGDDFDLSSINENAKAFYIKFENDVRGEDSNQSISVNFEIDYGEVPTAQIFVPTVYNKEAAYQIVMNIDRTHRVDTDTWNEVIEGIKPDIALKKYIYQVNGNDVEPRLGDIDTSTIAQEHNATYNMNKTPIETNLGDTVTYVIQLFNEGNIDGRAKEIVDYLPDGLEVNRVYGNNKDVSIKYINNKKAICFENPYTEYIQAYNGEDGEELKNKSQKIYVECKVKSAYTGIYTNVAEILTYDLANGADIDSQGKNWILYDKSEYDKWNNPSNRQLDMWKNYSNNQDTYLDGGMHPFKGQEDDDDFEKIKVNYLDLALTKSIAWKYNSNGDLEELTTDEVGKTKLDITGQEDVVNSTKHDLTYTMNKNAAEVYIGDKVVSRIKIFNEGKIDGIVKEVTDYLPDGLEFLEDETRQLNGEIYTYEYDTTNNNVTIRVSDTNGKTLTSYKESTQDPDSMEIKLVCKVTDKASGMMYNSAAITNYGYEDNSGTYIETKLKNIDIDSYEKTNRNDLRTKHIKRYDAQKNSEDSSINNFYSKDKSMLQVEDDDDVDAIKVDYVPVLDLALRKFISEVRVPGSESISYTDRTPEITDESIEYLKQEGTAKYEHSKLKIKVGVGDEIVYKIRVYNEGLENDYNGRATEITDYLPENLKFLYLEENIEDDAYVKNDWNAEYDEVANKVVLKYKGNTILERNKLKDSIGKKTNEGYYQEVALVCKVVEVEGKPIYNKNITNRAEITGEVAIDGEGNIKQDVKDKDSTPRTINSDKLDTWYNDTVINEDTPESYYPGEEDDDDFETVYVGSYNLWLRKVGATIENAISGTDFTIYKYRGNESGKLIDGENVKELTDMETLINETGEVGGYYPLPSEGTTDVYIIKENASNENHNNIFEGKYIKIIRKSNSETLVPAMNLELIKKGFLIYEDNGDSDYDNDTVVPLGDIYDYINHSTGNNGRNYYYIKNPEKGKFDFNLVKYITGTQNTLIGAAFKIKIKNKDTNTYVQDSNGNLINGETAYEVNDEGKITISGINIDKENVTYDVTITESTVPEGYIGIPEDITFEVKSELKDGNYVLVSGEPITVENTRAVIVNENEINVEIENGPKPTIHKGVKEVENQSSGYHNEITGDTYESEEDAKKVLHDWVINTTLPNGVDEYSIYEISDKIDDRLTYEGVASVKIIDGKNTVANLVEGTDYKVTYDEASRMLKITFIGQGQVISKTVKKNIGKTIEVRFNTKFALDDNGNIIALNQSVPNQATLTYGNGSTVESEKPEVHTGGVGLFKYDEKTKKALSGAHFKIATSKENAEKGIFLKDTKGKDVEKITNEKGIAVFEGLEFGEDALNKAEYKTKDETTNADVYKYDWTKVETTYYIVETEAPKGYEAIKDPIKAVVKKDNYNIEDITSLIQVGNTKQSTVVKKSKQWENVTNANLYRVDMELYKKGETTKIGETQSVIGNNEAKWENLDKYDANGNIIEYVVKETKAYYRTDENSETWVELEEGKDYVANEDTNSNTFINTLITPGKYTVMLSKVDKASKQGISGVTFEVNGIQTDPTKGVRGTTYVKDENGNQLEVNIDKDNVDVPDTYEITEIKLNNKENDYYKIAEVLKVKVTKKRTTENGQIIYKLDSVSFEGGKIVDGVAKKTVKLENDDTAEVTAKISGSTVTITIPNVKKEGTYYLKLIKHKKGTQTPVAGAKFNIIGGNIGNTEFTQNNAPLSENNYSQIITKTEPVAIWQESVKIRDIDIPDTYTLKEVDVGENNTDMFVGFTEPIKITINKNSSYNIESIGLTVGGKEATKDGNENLVFDKTIDNQTIEARLSLDKHTNTIILEVENPEKHGSFNLNLVKYIKGTQKTLTGAKFKIKIVNKDTKSCVQDSNGNSINGEKPYEVNNEGKITISGINIDKENVTYGVTITESTVPEGYLGLDGTITFTAVSKLNTDGKTYTLVPSKSTTIPNAKLVDVKENEILVEVENKVKPTIHKGVKDVENQSSGYHNEITGDTYESEEDAKKVLHDWVINTTLPNGVDEYSIYEISDKIDDRLTYEGVASVKIIDGKNTVANLVEGTDYKVTYDEASRMLKITFIGQGQVISKTVKKNIGKTIEVRFNTKFALDDNGNIIALNQSVPNQATLTYGNGSTVESEKPEVHTGGVGLFKYDEKTKKALSGAHFKIATSKENAEKGIFLKDTKGKDVEKITNEKGIAVFEGLEFGEDALNKAEYKTKDETTNADVYKYDWTKVETTYYIVETEAPKGYEAIKDPIKAVVKKDNYNIEDITSLIQVGNTSNIYDLALRKFITGVTDTSTGESKEITERIPQVDLANLIDETKTTATYIHSKDPVLVHTTDIVTYTLRVYNEGPQDAYASLIKDDIPQGLEFVSYTEGDGSINDTYKWKLVDENDNEVTDIAKAKYVVTNYLSKDVNENNLIKGFNKENMTELDYRDVKIQFKVVEPNTSDRVVINEAQISEETDKDGNPVKDRDSTPNKWVDGEDDQDIEKVKVLYFDLALRKWVTQAIVTENGKTVVTETRHKAEDDPEEVVKVDLKKSKVNNVTVKFKYSIRITNEGEIAGEATEIRDDIPNGLKFVAEDNPDWREENGQIVTNKLEHTTLQPGESAEVEIVLTWINGTDNMGVMINTAEINKDHNEYGTPDIDSTPGNNVPGEDDIDDAPVMLTVKTESDIIAYMILSLTVLGIIASGITIIRKKVV